MIKDSKRIFLSPTFQKRVFTMLLSMRKPSELAKILEISVPMLYHYKNNRTKNLPLYMIVKVSKLLDIDNRILRENTVSIQPSKDVMSKGLNLGRRVRREQLKSWSNEIPELHKIVENGTLNLEKWFNSYRKLIDFGSRHIESVKKDGNKLILKYTNYAKGKKKRFITVLPRKISINEEFQYFFGLWCGDKAGGGRLGVANKAPEINLATETYLNKLYQNTRFQMLLSSRLNYSPLPNVKVDEVVTVKNMPGDYVMVVFAVNGILKSFFEYLLQNLDNLLYTIPDKNIFFSGLFDAEGNVSLEDRYFRWSCKNLKEVEIYKRHLKEADLFRRYDGSSLITDSRTTFLKLIYPHLKHNAKINRINLLFFNRGWLEDRFKKVLICMNDNPGSTPSQLGRLLSRKKMWAQLRFLSNADYARREGYPMKFYITERGRREIGREGQ